MAKIKKIKDVCDNCKKPTTKDEPALYYSRFLEAFVCWKCLNIKLDEMSKMGKFEGK